MSNKFVFEDFPVYKKGLEFITSVDIFLESISQRSLESLKDQLRRASTSILLNIAEGSGRFHKNEKRRFYVTARGSVYECAACFQIFNNKKLISEEFYDKVYEILNEIARQLSSLINR